MEYEIGDDPQGLPEAPEGHRDGGLSDGSLFFRKKAPAKALRPYDAHAELEQMGEIA